MVIALLASVGMGWAIVALTMVHEPEQARRIIPHSIEGASAVHSSGGTE